MQKELIRKEHVDWLRKNKGMTFDDVENLEGEEADKFFHEIGFNDFPVPEYTNISRNVSAIC